MYTTGELLCTGPAVAILCLMAAIGIGLIIYGYFEGKVSAGATDVPRSVTCQSLIDEGVVENPHVLVTDVLAGQNYFTRVQVTKAEKASGNTANKPWEAVYLPLLPLTPEIRTRVARGEPFVSPPPSLVRVILVSHKIKKKEDLGQIFTPEGAIQGLLVNSISSLGSQTEKLLREAYPGVDLSKVVILEQGRKPTSQALLTSLFVGGSLLIGVAAMLGVVAVLFRIRK